MSVTKLDGFWLQAAGCRRPTVQCRGLRPDRDFPSVFGSSSLCSPPLGSRREKQGKCHRHQEMKWINFNDLQTEHPKAATTMQQPEDHARQAKIEPLQGLSWCHTQVAELQSLWGEPERSHGKQQTRKERGSDPSEGERPERPRGTRADSGHESGPPQRVLT